MAKEKRECQFLKTCKFFNNLQLPSTCELLKKFYCFDDYERCARYQIRIKGGQVTDDVWPDGKPCSGMNSQKKKKE